MYKTIIEVLSSLTPIVIGGAVVYIAWQQHQTNKNRLKMELFDRRYTVYYAVYTVLTKDFKDFNDKMYVHFFRNLSATRFLFTSKDKELDKKVLDFQEKVRSATLDIVKFRREHRMPLNENQTQATNALCKTLWDLRPEAIDVFSKYLTLNAHWKYRRHAMIAALVVGGVVLIISLVKMLIRLF